MSSPPPEALEAGRVAVGYARVDGLSQRQIQQDLAVLSPEERGGYARRRGCAGVEYLGAHALLRRTLSRYCSTDPSAWSFAPDGMGKPKIVGARPDERFRFNLSHTRGLVACVVSRDESVGIDVESSEISRGYEKMVERVLSPGERRDVGSLPASERLARFLEYWTLKEAHLKAKGTGIRSRLDALEFRLLGESGAQGRFETEEQPAGRSWHYLRLRPTQVHYIAVAVEGTRSPDWEILGTDG